MLFYIKCVSCSRIISQDLDKYFDDLNNIRNNPTIKKKDKEKMESELLDKYNIRMYCCRQRILGLLPYHEIIVS